jgi:hypothetical protein
MNRMARGAPSALAQPYRDATVRQRTISENTAQVLAIKCFASDYREPHPYLPV